MNAILHVDAVFQFLSSLNLWFMVYCTNFTNHAFHLMQGHGDDAKQIDLESDINLVISSPENETTNSLLVSCLAYTSDSQQGKEPVTLFFR